MTIPGAPGPIQPTPPTNMPGAAGGAGPTGGAQQTGGAAFGQKLDGPAGADVPGANPANNASPIDATAKVEFKDGTNPLDQAAGIRDEIASIREQFEQQIADGKVPASDAQAQVWKLLDLQTRVQDVAFRVELVTKVIEQGTGGIKQLSQTQT